MPRCLSFSVSCEGGVYNDQSQYGCGGGLTIFPHALLTSAAIALCSNSHSDRETNIYFLHLRTYIFFNSFASSSVKSSSAQFHALLSNSSNLSIVSPSNSWSGKYIQRPILCAKLLYVSLLSKQYWRAYFTISSTSF